MSVKITLNDNWTKVVKGEWTRLGLLEMMVDIDTRAKAYAPKDTSALVNSSRIDKVRDGYKLTFGSSRVPYARIQHEGGTIRPKKAKSLAWKADGELIFAKSVNIKATKYLEKGADAITRGNTSKYWRNKI